MDAKEYEKMYEAETRYFWFVAKHRLLLSIIGELLNSRENPKILDIGCGTGGFLKEVDSVGDAVGLDWDKRALLFCHKRGLKKLILADWDFPPLKNESFDAVVASDFLEHLDDDVRAVGNMYSVLKEGGIMLLTVPAHPWLFSSHDVALKHKRRYSRKTLTKTLQSAGILNAQVFYWGGVLLPFIVPIRMVQKIFLKREKRNYETIKYEVPEFLNNFFIRVLDFELRRIKKDKAMKLGSSLVAIAKKQ